MVNFSSAEPCNDYTESGLHPEHQEVVIAEHFQAYPNYIIENCERDSRYVAQMCEEQNDLIRPHLLQRSSSQAVRTHKAHRGSKRTMRRLRKRTHARLPAQMPASGVSKRSRWQQQTGAEGRNGNIKQTVARARQEHEEEKRGRQYGLPQRVGAKKPWCLGSEEPNVPSYLH